MKRITRNNFKSLLTKEKSLVKGANDPTQLYVFMGHPMNVIYGSTEYDKMVLHSLSTGQMLNKYIDTDEAHYLIESEADVLKDVNDPPERDSFAGVVDRINKVFK